MVDRQLNLTHQNKLKFLFSVSPTNAPTTDCKALSLFLSLITMGGNTTYQLIIDIESSSLYDPPSAQALSLRSDEIGLTCHSDRLTDRH